jgi:hypothetical protein
MSKAQAIGLIIELGESLGHTYDEQALYTYTKRELGNLLAHLIREREARP